MAATTTSRPDGANNDATDVAHKYSSARSDSLSDSTSTGSSSNSSNSSAGSHSADPKGASAGESLMTMEKGAVLSPRLKRMRFFQDFWFVMGGVAAGTGAGESLMTMGKGAVLSPQLKRMRFFQCFWFVIGGVAAGLFNALNTLAPAYLATRGSSANLIAVAAGVTRLATLARLPVAVVSDRYNICGLGYRRPWIFAGFILGALFYAILVAIESTTFNFGGFVVVLFLATVCNEMWDNTLDAYTVDVTPKWRVGYVQGTLLNGGRGVGLVAGALLFSQIANASDSGWAIVFIICAIISFLPALAVPVLPKPLERTRFELSSALAEFGRREIVAHVLFAFWSGVVINAKNTITPQFFIAVGSDVATFGLFSSVGGVAFFVGAVLFGWLMDKWRHHIVAIFNSIVTMGLMSSIIFTVVTTLDDPLANLSLMWPDQILSGLSIGGLIATNMALVMLEIKDEGVAGSFYAVFAVMLVVGFAVGGFLTGPLLSSVDFFGTNVAIAVSVLPLYVLVYFIFKGMDYSHEAMNTRSVEDVDIELGDVSKCDDSDVGKYEDSDVNTSDMYSDSGSKATL